MIGTGTSRALLAAVGCLFLASCGAAQSSSAPAGANSAATSASAPSASAPSAAATSSVAAPAATVAAVKPGGSGLTACALITEQDASAALGKPSGHGTAGGTPALSECIYDDGALIVSMRTNSKTFYDNSLSGVLAKGVPELHGIGDSAFKTGIGESCTLLMLKGTTILSVLFTGTGGQNVCVAVAKTGASKM
jgi:hypothetical protein